MQATGGFGTWMDRQAEWKDSRKACLEKSREQRARGHFQGSIDNRSARGLCCGLESGITLSRC